MDNKKTNITEEGKRKLIRYKLSTIIAGSIETEYQTDKFGNIVYRKHGRTTGINRIKETLNEWEERYDISKSEMRKILKTTFRNMMQSEPTFNAQGNELISILEEIELEEQVKKDIAKGNIEKYERDI